MFGRGVVKAGKGIALVISNKQLHDIIRIIKSLENSGALIDGISKIIKNEIERQEGEFLALLWTLGASLLGSLLTEKGVKERKKYKKKDFFQF